MKVTLICTDPDRWGFGVRTISAVLGAAGHSARLIFLASEAEQFSPEILEETCQLSAASDFIGLSCYSRGSQKGRQVARHLRQVEKPIIWGGLHATLNPRECAMVADVVCRGEGEETIVELADALQAGKDWRHLKNLAYMEQDRLVLNPLRPPFKNLDELPMIDFDRRDEYHLVPGGIVKVSQDPKDVSKGQVLAIGSRGCGYRCTYCCNSQLRQLYIGNGRYIRRLTPARYVDQIKTLYTKHFPNATDFFLIDEDFFMRGVEELKEFVALYKEYVGIPFECMTSPPRVTEEKLKILADAGLWRIRLGIESGSERTKTLIYDRPISNDDVLKASETIRRQLTVVAAYFFIIGNPYEKEADLIDTLHLMSKLAAPYYAQVFNLIFFPGSVLYNRAVADGMIAGAEDSGCELHYRSGFQYQKHAWKRQNLYLNVLVYLTEGKVTKYRLGLVPRCLLVILMLPAVVGFAGKVPAISYVLVAVKRWALRVRDGVGIFLKRMMRDPAGVYDMRLYVKRSVRRIWGRWPQGGA